MDIDAETLRRYFDIDYAALQDRIPFRLPDWYRSLCFEFGEVNLKPAEDNFASLILQIGGIYSLLDINKELCRTGSDLGDQDNKLFYMGIMFVGTYSGGGGLRIIGYNFKDSPKNPKFGGEFLEDLDEPDFEEQYHSGYELIDKVREEVGECRNDVYTQFDSEEAFLRYRESWMKSLSL